MDFFGFFRDDYVPRRGSWFLESEIVDEPVFDSDGQIVVGKRFQERIRYDLSERIDGKILPDIAKTPLPALERNARKGSATFYASVDEAYLRHYLRHFPLERRDVTLYNNIAYYFQKRGFDDLSAFLLEKILAKFPDRAVAHLNLADALRREDPRKSAFHYRRYVELMRKMHKEKRASPPRALRAEATGG
ncbi:hypothetical protein [Nitratifractor sp.]